jgi:hypothetical protein
MDQQFLLGNFFSRAGVYMYYPYSRLLFYYPGLLIAVTSCENIKYVSFLCQLPGEFRYIDVLATAIGDACSLIKAILFFIGFKLSSGFS